MITCVAKIWCKTNLHLAIFSVSPVPFLLQRENKKMHFYFSVLLKCREMQITCCCFYPEEK